MVPGVVCQSADVLFPGSGAEVIGDSGFAGTGAAGDSDQQLWSGHQWATFGFCCSGVTLTSGGLGGGDFQLIGGWTDGQGAWGEIRGDCGSCEAGDSGVYD